MMMFEQVAQIRAQQQEAAAAAEASGGGGGWALQLEQGLSHVLELLGAAVIYS
eukprot:COSAG01_NODE_2658_length_7302_cov_4.298626_2_plen_53_part_00